MKHAVNASNLHTGGGVQVAASFLSELVADHSAASAIAVFVSSEVHASLVSLGCAIDAFGRYDVVDVHGLKLRQTDFDRQLRKFDTVFTLFGPLYRWNVPFRSIVGFAQPWIIYPDNECQSRLPPLAALANRAKFWLQGLFFRRADALVVELEHVRVGVIRALKFNAENVHVVHNCLSSLYRQPARWKAVAIENVDCDLRLGFVGRNYPHKNTQIFPAIVAELERVFGIKARFFVTFNDVEWAACSAEFRAVCVNVGPLMVDQCPTFYQAMDAIVFPSLLECFSATPLEAMAMEKPLFLSDRPFNQDICKEHAHYFDPLRPASAAEAIAKVFDGDEADRGALGAAREHALGFSNASERAKRYLQLLTR